MAFDMFRFATLALIALLVSACGEDQWHAIVYPSQGDLTEFEFLGVYPDLDSCRDASLRRLGELGARISGDYECGLNCRFEEGWGEMRICEDTAQ